RSWHCYRPTGKKKIWIRCKAARFWVCGLLPRLGCPSHGCFQILFRIRNEITEWDLILTAVRLYDPGVDLVDNKTDFGRVAGSFGVRGQYFDAQCGDHR